MAAHPSSTRAATLATLDRLIAETKARRSELSAEIASGKQREQQLHDAVDDARRAYRATNDGIAESARAIEIALLSGADRRTVRAMQRQHRQAEDDSDIEYQQRRQRWDHRAGDGPVRGCPVGDNHALRALLMQDVVVGSYRHDPTVDTVKVKVLRPGVKKAYAFVQVPARDPITLTYVFEHILADDDLATRVLTRLRLPASNYQRLQAAGTDSAATASTATR